MVKIDDNGQMGKAESIIPPLVVILFGVLLLVWSADYGEAARRLPATTAALILVLGVFDLLSRVPSLPGRFLHTTLGAGFDDREIDFLPTFRSEVVHFAWVIGVVSSTILLGFLLTIPLFVFSYMYLLGRRRLWPALLTAIAVIAGVGLVFEVLLDYTLFPGLLFGGELYS